MSDCIFCKIVAGEIPSFKLYEDERFLAFLDVNPVSKGHTLVIPKKHCVNMFDFDAEANPGYLPLVQRVARDICTKLGATDFNIVNASGRCAQQSVDHLHFHIVPRFREDGIDIWFHGKRKYTMEELASLHGELTGN